MLLKFLKIHNFQLLKYRPQHLFSQKKLSKLIIDANDYLKDTSFDTNIKAEWSQKEKQTEKEIESKSQTKTKMQEQIYETEAEFEEAGIIFIYFQRIY